MLTAIQVARGTGQQLCHSIGKTAPRLSNYDRRHSSMLAWKIDDSLDNSADTKLSQKLKCTETKLPILSTPWDVLVRVHATSINPLDVRMTYGYGRRVLDLMNIATNFEPRITNDRYPLTLGRDFSGEVIAAGPYASDKYIKGDLVFGAVEPQKSGAHAEYVSVPQYCLTKKPENLSHLEAASIPFVSLTAYSALCVFGNLVRDRCLGKQVLVIGGSGGVGSFAIQLLKLWGANVHATCSDEKIDWLESALFVDRAISYNDPAELQALHGRFDFVLDCGDYDGTSKTRHDIISSSLKYLKPYSQSVYVTLSPPILSNIDQHGLILGTAGTVLDAVMDSITGLKNLNSARWAVFLPNKNALDYVAGLYEDEAIAPQVSSVHSFDQMPEAFEELQAGRAKGKVVVDVSKLETGKKLNVSANSDNSERANSATSRTKH